MRERQRIQMELHDHAGSRITDLQILLNRVRNDLAPALYDELNQHLMAIVREFRLVLDEGHDLQMIEENLVDAVHFNCLRRYAHAGRPYQLQAPTSVRQRLHDLDAGAKFAVFSALREIATNDLKYGCGPSHWQFEWDQIAGRVRVYIETRVNQHTRSGATEAGGGFGIRNIIERLREIDGRYVCEQEARGHFRVTVMFPVQSD